MAKRTRQGRSPKGTASLRPQLVGTFALRQSGKLKTKQPAAPAFGAVGPPRRCQGIRWDTVTRTRWPLHVRSPAPVPAAAPCSSKGRNLQTEVGSPTDLHFVRAFSFGKGPSPTAPTEQHTSAGMDVDLSGSGGALRPASPVATA
uniref:Uncharacterized protein n=1 Tax=Trichuris muris TaxID=70415 RepID=A0A5S6Q8N4_TRIMR